MIIVVKIHQSQSDSLIVFDCDSSILTITITYNHKQFLATVWYMYQGYY